jgi:hypothetical protein
MCDLPMIDKIDDRPWDIVAAFRDLNQRLAMLDFYQNHTMIECMDMDVQPDHVVES